MSDNGVIALLGSSGCGKTLTLKCIAGIEKPDKGKIIINEQIVFDSEKKINLPPQERKTGYMFQNYALFPTMTVFNNISCVIKKPKDQKKLIIDEIIKSFQLENISNLYPRQISGGQQQRVALARILVSQPEIILLDEPFSALDTNLKQSIEAEIAAVLQKFKGSAVIVTHDSGEAYRLSDQVAIMSKGEVQCIGPKQDIFDKYFQTKTTEIYVPNI